MCQPDSTLAQCTSTADSSRLPLELRSTSTLQMSTAVPTGRQRSTSMRRRDEVKSIMPLIFVLVAVSFPLAGGVLPLQQQLACVFENHLVTDENWYGFIANISVITTGRLTFEFIYPADKCCPTILFYSDEQIATINSRMKCWDKVNQLRPAEDLLPLTPKFSWSGCHLTHPHNVPMYVCKGGRSFTVDQQGAPANHGHHGHRSVQYNGADSVPAPRLGTDRLSTWYIAVSNCDSMHGLDLQYRVEVYGHARECRSASNFDHINAFHHGGGSGSGSGVPSPRPVVGSRDTPAAAAPLSGPESAAATSTGSRTATTGCVIEGEVNTTGQWYGFIANVSLKAGGRISYWFSFPHYSMHTLYVIHYTDADLPRLLREQECWGKHGIVSAKQVTELAKNIKSKGCEINKTANTDLIITCQYVETYGAEPRRLYLAADNCRLKTPFVFRYRLEVFNHEETDSCSSAVSAIFFASKRTLMTLTSTLTFILVLTCSHRDSFLFDNRAVRWL